MQPVPTPSRWAGLGVALTLSTVLLLVSALGFLESLLFLLESHHITRDFDFLRIALSPTGLLVGGFALFILLSHVVLALLVWVAARAWWWRYAHTGAQLRLFVLATWLLWALALLCANAALSPWSDAARFVRGIASLALGPVALWQVVGLLALASLWPAAQDLWRWLAQRVPRRALLAGSAALLLGLGAGLVPFAPPRHAPADRPNVIIIGIDSLRLPWVGAFGGDLTPELDRFIADATLFEWSYSPLGRTFGAWMSLLTGQMPRTNGVRFNVMPPEAYADTVTLADRFRSAGWRTVFAMDEMRFAPIDEDLGFDQVIGPPIGAHDFLIATIADLPVTNVLVNTVVGRYLLPTIHANRTAAVSYQPESFDRMVWAELETGDQPLFLAVHFTLPHHPIFWATAPRTYQWESRPDVGDATLMREQLYRAATREVDAQVGRFLAEAGRRGLLDDAIVVLLSDHGEAVGLPEDDGLRLLHAPPEVRGLVFANSRRGHGSATTTPTQFETLLAFRRYGGAETWRGRQGIQTSLIDVAPTLLSLAGQPVPAEMEGADLAPLVRGGTPGPELRRRVLFTETGYNPTNLRLGQEPDERRLFLESIEFYRMDDRTGRIHFRTEQVPILLALKERAAIASPWILSAVPNLDTQQTLWMLYNRNTGDWVRYPQDLALLPGRPPAALLEAALLEHYGPELTPPTPTWPEALTVHAGQPEPVLPPAN